MDKSCGVIGVVSVSEALSLLKDCLKRHGLDDVRIYVSSYGLTPEQSAAIARDIVSAGFGDRVWQAKEPAKYESADGYFSWNTVEQGGDHINLFFNLPDDDQPVNYIPTDKEVC